MASQSRSSAAAISDRVRQSLATHSLLPPESRVVVAVSGGVDSMVLIHLLRSLAPSFGWKLSIAHFNHRLRGHASLADERFVRATARRLRLPCDVGSFDVRRHAAGQGISIEMAARDLRHAFLARCARKRRASAVALAHHAGDQVELFLLRLLRGAGGEGLAGMKPSAPSPSDRRIRLVRPLLDFSKNEVTAFARTEGIRFREDASNSLLEFDRNWIRHSLLPLLVKRQPAVGEAILRAMSIAGAESDFVSLSAKAWLESCHRADFTRLHVAVQRRVVQLGLRALGVAADFQLIEQLRHQPGKPVSAGPGLNLVRDVSGGIRRAEPVRLSFRSASQVIELRAPPRQAGPLPSGLSLSAPAPDPAPGYTGQAAFAGGLFKWRIFPKTHRLPLRHREGRELFDADRVGRFLRLRHWLPGDRFQPIGLPTPVRLQDWFTNRKIPAPLRRKLVLAETECGDVFWIEGERIGESCKVTPETRTLLEWQWSR